MIKTLIKKTKTTEKQHIKAEAAVSASIVHTLGAHSPPGLSRSVPTSATSPGPRTRGASEDSQYSDYDSQFYNHGDHDHPYHTQIVSQYGYTQDPSETHYYGYPTYPSTPYEVDVKTERETFINDVPTRTDSTMSTFSTYHPPHTSLPPLLEHEWSVDPAEEELYTGEGLVEGEVFTQFPNSGHEFVDFEQPSEITSNTTTSIELDEQDNELLKHFFENVLGLIFPIMDVNETGSVSSRVVIPALKSNKVYLSTCLASAAIHLKSTTPSSASDELDLNINKHRFAAIQQLCESLNHEEEHGQNLEATLALITQSCIVGAVKDDLPHIPWHKHFDAAFTLIQRLQLPQLLLESTHTLTPPPFNMTVAAWIDILGATLLGQAPKFADIYREKHLSGSSSGLAEIMGCDDRIMYLISELSCLTGLQRSNSISEEQLCSHITNLGQQIELHESSLSSMDSSVISDTGAVRPRILQRNITLLFSKAARITLCALIPGITNQNNTMRNLLVEFTHLLSLIPTGPAGFDRCIAWPLLIAGAHSTPDSIFRTVFAERSVLLGGSAVAETGSLGRVTAMLHEIWRGHAGLGYGIGIGGGVAEAGEADWRDVMRVCEWDFLIL